MVLSQTIAPSGNRSSGSVRILLADDDATFRYALKCVLGTAGYEVIEASDGAMALDLLAAAATGASEPLDVVVLDCLMPFCSGLGILEVMRTFPDPPPTLLVTSFMDRSVDVLASRLGAVRVMHKPVDLDDVLAAVLAASRLRRAPG